jgi:hypothetical protein
MPDGGVPFQVVEDIAGAREAPLLASRDRHEAGGKGECVAVRSEVTVSGSMICRRRFHVKLAPVLMHFVPFSAGGSAWLAGQQEVEVAYGVLT